jgi:hypothetical protein
MAVGAFFTKYTRFLAAVYRFSMVSQEALEAIADLYVTAALREYDNGRADRGATKDTSPPTEASNPGVGDG